MKYLLLLLVAVSTTLVSGQLQTLSCHRCYGSGYCNDGNSTDFIEDTRTWNCNLPEGATNVAECMTATVHEVGSSFTLRGCFIRNPTQMANRCENLINTVLEPFNTNGAIVQCSTCTTDRCNNQTLTLTPESSATIGTPVLAVLFVMKLLGYLVQ